MHGWLGHTITIKHMKEIIKINIALNNNNKTHQRNNKN